MRVCYVWMCVVYQCDVRMMCVLRFFRKKRLLSYVCVICCVGLLCMYVFVCMLGMYVCMLCMYVMFGMYVPYVDDVCAHGMHQCVICMRMFVLYNTLCL